MGWSDEKHALEWLFAAGEVTVAGRRGFERLYDLPERVLPASVLDVPEPGAEEAQRGLLLHAANALGVASETDLRDYFRLEPADSKARLAELVEAGALRQVRVQGWSQAAYVAGEPVIPRKVAASALLSPFDSLVWNAPAPSGCSTSATAWRSTPRSTSGSTATTCCPSCSANAWRRASTCAPSGRRGRLAVHAVHEEQRPLGEEGMLALAGQLREMATWLALRMCT